jgi:hypothetical protein
LSVDATEVPSEVAPVSVPSAVVVADEEAGELVDATVDTADELVAADVVAVGAIAVGPVDAALELSVVDGGRVGAG